MVYVNPNPKSQFIFVFTSKDPYQTQKEITFLVEALKSNKDIALDEDLEQKLRSYVFSTTKNGVVVLNSKNFAFASTYGYVFEMYSDFSRNSVYVADIMKKTDKDSDILKVAEEIKNKKVFD